MILDGVVCGVLDLGQECLVLFERGEEDVSISFAVSLLRFFVFRVSSVWGSCVFGDLSERRMGPFARRLKSSSSFFDGVSSFELMTDLIYFLENVQTGNRDAGRGWESRLFVIRKGPSMSLQ